MTEILHSPHHLPSPSSSANSPNDGLSQQTFFSHGPLIRRSPVALYRRGFRNASQLGGVQINVFDVFSTVLRKSLVGCTSVGGVEEQVPQQQQQQLMEIGSPTNVRHVAHVTYDRFNGFLGLPVEFEPEVPRRPPSASTRVFGVSTESMHLSFDSRGNCVPTILLMMQRRLYSQGGLQAEGIFRINPENGQETFVREQLNNGLIPDNIDVHCLAGLIKAWFRELPRGILDSLSPEQVMQAQSEDECTHLVRQLPPTEAALLDWAINLMADVAQLENMNKMNARNVAMVFAPNMSQMSDPLTALMYAVQVMNFLKTLIVKTLKEREDSVLEAPPTTQSEEPLDDDGHCSVLKPTKAEADEASDDNDNDNDDDDNDDAVSVAEQPRTADPPLSKPEIDDETHTCSADTTNRNASHKSSGRSLLRIHRAKTGQSSDANGVKKGSRKHNLRSNEEVSAIRHENSRAGRTEAWR
ncbi:rho GTPase-activating protein 5-like [Andrographis paniculata]|uniref:rho GTPase-activating protein 5-like n=1 Tax=Andrographis paniculata TaxID=175694 RepID=UPI0021E91A86|nr:rho GTPase-activating protein 5-like [Andrographis paniculata]XP_051150395.1 rho GTPase-activating protein 5-like [Andrographis paniculata]XP_051150396.1 rho GTPase-activating protein 5-like [Andrographis paniculata]XP_051150397.1 rho GTPase-activating protein 5-like [Andrographis paniculata]XP_051150399.1 rho GTPase-activating protein 5-like [Andrographis paniculata]XP_051150400.1 rho GTPase-activating protein 5-like [Andrographis paniculata]